MAGRRLKLDKRMIEDICRYVENGNTNKDACAHVGIAEATLYAWIVQGEDIQAGKTPKLRVNKILPVCSKHHFRIL